MKKQTITIYRKEKLKSLSQRNELTSFINNSMKILVHVILFSYIQRTSTKEV